VIIPSLETNTKMTVRTTTFSVMETIFPSDIIVHISSFVFRPETQFQLKAAVRCWIYNREYAMLRFGHISHWDTSEITDMSHLFDGYNKFNDDISSWNVSNVTDFSAMFQKCQAFNKDISQWNIEKGINFSYMFNEARKFKGKNIRSWKPKSAQNMCYMFAFSGFTYDISCWSEYVNMSIPMDCIFLDAGIKSH
jgi:surface protein